MIVDTHAHLDFPDFSPDIDDVVRRATELGVTRIVTIGTSVESSQRAIALAERYPSVYAAIGIHPNHAMEAGPGSIGVLRELAQNPRVVAIGETGLDYYRLPSSRIAHTKVDALGNEDVADIDAAIEDGAVKAAQADFFGQQLDLAADLGLNVIVHQRGDCWDDTLAILAPYRGKLRAVFHCFGGTPEEAEELISMGHLVSFTGIVTFRNAEIVQQTAAAVRESAYMVETDCPFLAPVPFRGKRCEPAHTRIVVEKIAELRGEPVDKVAQATTQTALDFFRFSQK